MNWDTGINFKSQFDASVPDLQNRDFEKVRKARRTSNGDRLLNLSR
jgi:hypothetical protein